MGLGLRRSFSVRDYECLTSLLRAFGDFPKHCYGWRAAEPIVCQFYFDWNFVPLRRFMFFGGLRVPSGPNFLRCPCQSPLVFHWTTDHVHRLRHPGPDISVKDQIPKPCFKARRRNSSCHVRKGAQPRSLLIGAGKFGCAARFSPRLKTVLILLPILPPIFG